MKPKFNRILVHFSANLQIRRKKSYQVISSDGPIPGANVFTRQSRGLLKLILMESILLQKSGQVLEVSYVGMKTHR
jgi:hypothetical protein